MYIVTIFPSDTVPATIETGTFGSSPDIEFVQVVAVVALFAEAFEPVLADEVVEVCDAVLVGAGVAEWAVAFAEGFADGARGIETDGVWGLEEGREG